MDVGLQAGGVDGLVAGSPFWTSQLDNMSILITNNMIFHFGTVFHSGVCSRP
jgi:hypothetical protein